MRRVRVVALSRRNLQQFTRRLQHESPDDWPKFLKRARAIALQGLAGPEFAGDVTTGAAAAHASEIVIRAVAAAHECAEAVSARALANERNRVRQEVISALERLLKPVERQRRIQRALDEVAQHEFREGHTDLEVVSSFFNGCADVVRKDSAPDAKRIFKALGGPTDETDERRPEESTTRILKLINHYEAMHPTDRETVEAGLRELLADQSATLAASGVFGTIIHALTIAATTHIQEQAGDLLASYVSAAAKIWRRSGLRPSRARDPEDPEYRSRFHVFVELVLIDQFDPRSRLFDRADEQELRLAREVHARLPKELREDTHVGPRYEWLISDHYLKEALGPTEKSGAKTP